MDKSKNVKNNGKNEAFTAIVNQVGGHVSAYVPELCKLFGAKAGIMLSQLIYWQVHYPEKEFYISVSEMFDQTGLNAEEQRTARERLCRLGLITAELKGFPRNWYYTVDVAGLIEQCRHSSRKSINDFLINRESQSMGKSLIEKVHAIGGESPSSLVEKVHQHWWRKSTNVNMNHKTTTKDYNIKLHEPPPPSENEIFDDDQSPIEEEEVSQGGWLSESLLDDLRNFGVFENNITEVEEAVKAGWSEEAIRELMSKVEDDHLAGRVQSKPGTLLHRLRNLRPPKPKPNKYKICPYCGQYPCECDAQWSK
jgi:hypothetical protein